MIRFTKQFFFVAAFATASLANADYLKVIDLGSARIAYGINNADQVVGTLSNPSGGNQAFEWSFGTGAAPIGPVGGYSSGATGINNSGQVVGTLSVGSQSKAVIWSSTGSMQLLGTLGGASSWANGINDAGQVVGTSINASGLYRGYVWSPTDGMTDLGSLQSGGNSYAYGISGNGAVTGWSDSSGAVESAFTWTTGGGIQALGSNPVSGGYGINDSGQVAGFGAPYATLWSPAGSPQPLTTMFGGTTAAINDSGEAVGTIQLTGNFGDDVDNAFLYKDGTMYDLNTLIAPITRQGWTLNQAFGINAQGDIVGYGTYNGHEEAFMLSTVPEPSEYAILFVGVLSLASRRRKA